MANAAGYIQESIWRDEHWRKLSRSAQALYMQLLSQKELDCAGILPLQPNKWAKGCQELTVDQVWTDLEELQREKFVFYDADTEEVFIRTYIRNSNVIKVPNMLKSARRSAELVASGYIKPFMAAELRATGNQDCIAVAERIDPTDPPPEPFGNRSETLPEPFRNGSNRNPSETLPEGSGVGVGVGVPHQRRYPVGEARPKCSKHEENYDGPCGACKRRREWDEANATAVEADELNRKRKAREIAANCPVCGGTNWIPDTDPAVKCDHQQVRHA